MEARIGQLICEIGSENNLLLKLFTNFIYAFGSLYFQESLRITRLPFF